LRWAATQLFGWGGVAAFLIQRSNDIVLAELITLDALTVGQGVGTTLVEALVSKLRGERVAVLEVTTTNDNLNALRFYQRRGFRITRVRPGVVNEARRIKPSIPVVGEYGILIRDEIDLELRVDI
jgi:ribosomal protein S18 acetylase RimI-like enzyme